MNVVQSQVTSLVSIIDTNERLLSAYTEKKIGVGLHLATSYTIKPQEVYCYIFILYLKLVLMSEEIITCITRLSCQTFSEGLPSPNNDMDTLLIMRVSPLA